LKVSGQLERAQLENLASAPTVGIAGRIYWDTVLGRPFLDDGTLWRALLRNDQKLILGNSGTAAENTRIHRGAAGVVQLVSGADVTAEGTLSTALNQISARQENYTDAGKPAFGNAGRVIWLTDTKSFLGDTGTAWVQVGGGALSVTAVQTVTSAGTITTDASSRQLRYVKGDTGGVAASTTPFGTGGWTDGTEVIIYGESDTDFLDITYNDANYGVVGNFDIYSLTNNKGMRLIWKQSALRWLATLA